MIGEYGVCNCGDRGIIRVVLSEGCFAYPDDREQSLCYQHIYSLRPLGTMKIIDIHDPGGYEWYESTRGRKWSAANWEADIHA